MNQTYDPLVADALIQRYRIKGATRQDMAGAVHILLDRGWSMPAIADRLSISETTVARYRALDVTPEAEVAQTYPICNCPEYEHEYDSKASYYDRKECTT